MNAPLLNRKQMPGLIKLDYGNTDQIVQDMMMIEIEKFISINLARSTEFGTYPLSYRTVYDTFFKGKDEGSLASDLYVQYTFTEQTPNTVSPELLSQSGATVKSRMRRIQEDSPYYIPEADDSKYSALTEECPNSIRELVARICATGDTVSRVRLAGVAPGHNVLLHRDHDPSKLIRLHIPIKTNAQCVIDCENKSKEIVTAHLEQGKTYILNTGRRHAARNESNEWRVHLLVDIRGQNFIKQYTTETVID
jgi:hypothetical protein